MLVPIDCESVGYVVIVLGGGKVGVRRPVVLRIGKDREKSRVSGRHVGRTMDCGFLKIAISIYLFLLFHALQLF